MQDEIRDELPQIDTNRKHRAALIGIAALAVAITVGLFWADGSFDDQTSAFGELSSGHSVDITIGLLESFAVDADGTRTRELDSFVAELEADGAVAGVEYLGPSRIQGIAPDAPGLEAFGHQIVVALNRSFLPGAKKGFVDTYKDRPGIDGIAVAA